MPDFAFRISLSWNECSVPVLAYLSELSTKLIIYEHEADEEVSRTHIHGLIMGCSRSDDTLRNKLFTVKYTKNYELKSTYKTKKGIFPVDDGYITYMSEGTREPKYNKGYTKEEVDALKAAYINYEEVKKATKVARDPTKTITRYELIKECLDMYGKDYLDTPRYTGHDLEAPPGNKIYPQAFDQHRCCEIVIAKCIEHKQTMGFYKLVDIVDNVHMLRFPQSFHKKLHGYFVKRDEKLST